ncbi:MAG TPA: NUDIX domain-containing protein [Patescibacteria group bacterium]|jgi:8-oxo-dGTP pyrophosphatase MutT (NUDIX family)
MPASKISLDQAKPNKLFYVVATAMPYRKSDGRCLILKRDERETAHPGKWGVTGGKLEHEDFDLAKPTRMNGDVYDFQGAFEKLLRKEAKEEAAIKLGDDFRYLGSLVFVRPDETPVALFQFAAEYAGGDVKPEVGGFTDFAWVNAEEVKQYDCIDGIHDEVSRTIAAFG